MVVWLQLFSCLIFEPFYQKMYSYSSYFLTYKTHDSWNERFATKIHLDKLLWLWHSNDLKHSPVQNEDFSKTKVAPIKNILYISFSHFYLILGFCTNSSFEFDHWLLYLYASTSFSEFIQWKDGLTENNLYILIYSWQSEIF